MRALDSFPSIFLYRLPADMRKQIIGLSQMVQGYVGGNPFSESLYVFCNRRRSLIKCLYWDKSGFAMWVKQLDQDRFPWPKKLDHDVVTLTPREFGWLLEGIDIWRLKRHKSLEFDAVF